SAIACACGSSTPTSRAASSILRRSTRDTELLAQRGAEGTRAGRGSWTPVVPADAIAWTAADSDHPQRQSLALIEAARSCIRRERREPESVRVLGFGKIQKAFADALTLDGGSDEQVRDFIPLEQDKTDDAMPHRRDVHSA